MINSLKATVLRALDTTYEDTITCNTPNCSLVSAGGRALANSVTLTNNGATHVNLFKITGAIRVQEIYGVCTEATDSTTFSSVDFDVYDGTTATTMTTATDCSGIAAKDMIVKTADDGSGLTFVDGSDAAYTENATRNKAFTEGIIIESSAGNTYVRLGYTGDATTDIDINFVLRYEPLTPTSKVESV